MLKGEFIDNYLVPTVKEAYKGHLWDMKYINLGRNEYVIASFGTDKHNLAYQQIDVTATSCWGILKSIPDRISATDKWWITEQDYEELLERNQGDKEG